MALCLNEKEKNEQNKIYIWNLQSETYKTISILKSRTNILDYGLYYSKNGNYYIIGRYTNWIYLWELYGDENPVRIIALKIDQFDWLIVNTRMKRKTYQILGEESYDSFRNRKIYRLVEKDELKFSVELICDQESIIGGYCKAKDGKGLVRYFSVDNGCVKEIGQWFRGTCDIFKAVIGTMKGKEYIFLIPSWRIRFTPWD